MIKPSIVLAAFLLASCAHTPPPPTVKYKDGEIPLAADYKTWPKAIMNIQRPDAKQVRDMYINNVGYSAKRGEMFPNGTVSVIELYKANAGPDGALLKGADGKLVKGDLIKVFVMGKGEGWGESAPAGLKNGDWVYASYDAKGAKAPDPIAACRSCHLPLADKDFFFRYDEYHDLKARSPGY
jgi:hypothetical protein